MAQRERENFYRYSTGIVDHGNKALGLLLEKELSLKNESITDFINRNQHEIYHLYMNKRQCCQCVNGKLSPTTPQYRVLHHQQINKLIDQCGNTLPVHRPRLSYRQPLCCRPANTAITLNDMDITLKSCLLVNFASNCQHGTPERRAVENLVEYRNILYAHVNEAKMPDIDFQKNFPAVEGEILVIAKFCNAENIMRQNLQDTKIRPLDETMCLQYQSLLLSEIAENNQIQEKLLDLESKMDQSNQNMQNQLAAINVNMEGTFSVLKEMQQEQSTSVKNLNERVTDSENHIQADVEASKKHIATKIDNMEHQMSQEHGGLHDQVKHTENNIKTSIVEAENMMSKKLEDLRHDATERDERLHTALDEIRKQMEKHNTTDQRKKNIIAQTESRIKLHIENVNYVKTRAVKEGQIILDQEGILLLVSKGGAGKTTICLQLASMYQGQGYVPLMFIDQEIKEYRDVINPDEKCIVIIDDLFGRTHVEFNENIHTNILHFLLATVHKGVKLIFTVRQNANLFMRNYDKNSIFNESRVLDLDTCTKCNLSTEEKIDILSRYMDSNKLHLCSCQDHKTSFDRLNFCAQIIQLPDQSIKMCKGIFCEIVENESYIGFPEACRLFCSEKTFTFLGINYFNSPTSSLVDKIKDIFVQGLEPHPISMYQYCALVYIALQGYLEVKIANNFEGNDFFKIVLNNLFCDNNEKISKTGIEKALEKIEGILLKKDFVNTFDSNEMIEAWKFKHDTIYEAVLISVGNECPEMYLNYAGFYSILRNVKPRTSKWDASDCSLNVYISDDILIKKIESMLNYERSGEGYYGLAWDIGEFVRECALVNRNDRFVKKLFELIPLDTFTKVQIQNLFDGLTNGGKDKSIVLYHPDIFKTFKVDWFNLSVTLALCRPKSSNLDFHEFIGVDDESLLMHICQTNLVPHLMIAKH